MAEAQEPPLQPQAQAQAQQVQPSAQAQPLQPGGPVVLIPAVANIEPSSQSHGSLPALVSSNLPDSSILDESPPQPSQAPAELETHTQYPSATHDPARAHVKSSQGHNRQWKRPQPEDTNLPTNIQQASTHGATEAAEGIEAEKRDAGVLLSDVTRSVYISPAPVHISDLVSTTTPTIITTSSTAAPTESTRSTAIVPLTRDTSTTADQSSSSPPALMSNPPQHPGHQRPPVGFPSPTYGAQSMYGYGSPSGQPGDPYRGPAGAHQPMSLPSMRTFDPVQQQQAQQAPMAQQMMQVQATMPPYYGHPVPLAGNPYSMPPDAMASRYALPPNDPRFLGNPRNKKVCIAICHMCNWDATVSMLTEYFLCRRSSAEQRRDV